jgi:hypothetical protein
MITTRRPLTAGLVTAARRRSATTIARRVLTMLADRRAPAR